MDREELRSELRRRLAELLELTPEEVDPTLPFSSFGIVSRDAAELSGDLADWLDLPLESTLFYDYPTIDSLADHLAAPRSDAAAAPGPAAADMGTDEAIAVTGIACRFPGAPDKAAFWRLLTAGNDAIREVPPERWDPDPPSRGVGTRASGEATLRWGGFIDGVALFDAEFFGISRLEAERMDPQHRLLLELAWELFEDAGVPPARLRGSNTGIFLGISTNDYASLQDTDPEALDFYTATGNAFSIAANRLSYVFDLRGPSLAVDTACSSSLVAVDLACQNLRHGSSELALAGGVNLILSPDNTVMAGKAGLMAADGRCKAFDADADGYVRSEGLGLVLLKPLSRALADGDRVYGVIRGSATNQDGATNGLTAPNRFSQEAVLREAYQRAGVSPGEVGYIETHGSGTALGDAIELSALGTVVGADGSPGERCPIGSVKSNLGHLEAAAGVAGLIKVLLSLERGWLPPSLHFRTPPDDIDLEAAGVRVVDELERWSGEGLRLAGVSSFGFGGTNAHVVVEQPPRADRPVDPPGGGGARGLYLLVLSAKSSAALEAASERLADHLMSSEVELAALADTLQRGREALSYRRCLLAADAESVVAALRSPDEATVQHGVVVGDPLRVVFHFPPRQNVIEDLEALASGEPAFRDATERCLEVLRARHPEVGDGWLTADGAEALGLASEWHFTVRYGLACLMDAWGVHADAYTGSGVGGDVAACLRGGISVEEALGDLSTGGETRSGPEPAAPAEAEVRLDLAPPSDRRESSSADGARVVAALDSDGNPRTALLRTLGQLWVQGVDIDWTIFQGSRSRIVVDAPSYPFQRQPYWRGPPLSAAVPEELQPFLEPEPEPFERWFHVPAWRHLELDPDFGGRKGSIDSDAIWLVLANGPLGEAIAQDREAAGGRVHRIEPAAVFERRATGWAVRPDAPADLTRVLAELEAPPRGIVHLWTAEADGGREDEADRLAGHLRLGFGSLLALARSLGEHLPGAPIDLTIVSRGAHHVAGFEGDQGVRPEAAMLLGPCRVLPLELAGLRCRGIDLPDASDGDAATQVVREIRRALPRSDDEPRRTEILAYRGGERWVEDFTPVPPEEVQAAPSSDFLRAGGTYLVTGGLGGVGLAVADYLARRYRSRLVLLNRTPLPPREEWPEVTAEVHGEEVARRVRAIQALEVAGGEVGVVAADVADEAAVERAVASAERRFGAIDGVVHAAGVPGVGVAQLKPPEMAAAVLAPKVEGTLVLERVFTDRPLDFFALFSSVVTVTGGGLGQVDYCAANAFLDAFAASRSSGERPVVAIDWGEWQWDNWQNGLGGFDPQLRTFLRRSRARFGISDAKGASAFERALAFGVNRVIVSPRPLETLRELGDRFDVERLLRHDRPRRETDSGGDKTLGARELEARIAELWQGYLGVEKLEKDQNFFELGGNSLLGMQVTAELRGLLGRDVPVAVLYEAPTVATLARRLAREEPSTAPGIATRERPVTEAGGSIAILGMAGRFPRARDVSQLWRNLLDGVEALTFFGDDELLAAGVDPQVLADPQYVKAGAVLDDVDRFDAELFGYSPREAELMDPQHRFFLEVAWEALEDAGHDPQRFPGSIGVFGGANLSTYLLAVLADPETARVADPMQLGLLNSSDSLTTKVSYKLDLCGPSVAVQTFCSTSAVAIHLACRSLERGDCDIALAGGVRIAVPHRVGYRWQPGGIDSPDGHTRAFDEAGRGSVVGNGVGIVVLRRLADAQADGDHVRAVIGGTAMNNDGSLKVGYTAPSVDAQARVIAGALDEAGWTPESVGYIETHGTGTEIGDPIEAAALHKALGGRWEGDGSCVLGSVKTNLGHLDRAAGVAGLIKAAKVVESGWIPPTLHFRRANPEARLDDSPFYVETELREWRPEGPRRAGVNALGIGGTNVHFMVEEPPPAALTDEARQPPLLLLSANTEEALETMTDRLAGHLREHPKQDIADVAWTLQTGRRVLPHRRMLVARGREDAAAALADRDPRRVITLFERERDRGIVFLFAGLGAQYVGMGKGLYDGEPIFRRHLDLCAEHLEPLLGLDVREVLYQPVSGGAPNLRRLLRREEDDPASERLNRTSLVHPILFSLEYALARLLVEWFGEPRAVAGYSLGEYTAACIAGVFELPDALDLVARRARRIEELPPGRMLAVPLPRHAVERHLETGLSLAAENGPSLTVLAGPEERLAEVAEELGASEVACRWLPTRHAFHSRMMDPLTEPVTALAAEKTLRPARIPLLSNVTGRWLDEAEAIDPSYWGRHLSQPVLFSQSLDLLLESGGEAILEVGPGQDLGSFVKQHPAYERTGSRPVLSTLPSLLLGGNDGEHLLGTAGKAWLTGVPVDWKAVHGESKRRRVSLPTYPFADRRFWLPQGMGVSASVAPSPRDVGDSFYLPNWRPEARPAEAPRPEGLWLVAVCQKGPGAGLAAASSDRGARVIRVEVADDFESDGERFLLDPCDPEHWRRLFATLAEEERGPLRRIVHALAWGGTEEASPEAARRLGFDSLVALIRGLVAAGFHEPLALDVVADWVCGVEAEDPIDPHKALLFGPALVAPQELPHLRCRVVDPGSAAIEAVIEEVASESRAPAVALRGDRRLVEDYRPHRLAPVEEHGALRRGGVYLITGGLGGIGSVLASHLAETLEAKLVLVGRRELPDRSGWGVLLEDPEADAALVRKLRRLVRLEEAGAEVLPVAADVGDPEALARAVAAAEERFGTLHGVIHAAGQVDPAAMRPLAELDPEGAQAHFLPKVQGTLNLARCLEGRDLDFRLLFSSTSSVLGGLSLAAYSAANRFLDAFALDRAQHGEAWTSVDWDVWSPPDEEVERLRAGSPVGLAELRMIEREGGGLSPEEGVEAVRRVLADGNLRLVHSPSDLRRRMDQWVRRTGKPEAPSRKYARPSLDSAYVAARSADERQIAEIFQNELGVERVGVQDNYFDLGGTSLSAIQVTAALQERFDEQLSSSILFEAPTVADLAKRLRPEGDLEAAEGLAAAVARRRPSNEGHESLAVVGMAGRFPGAKDVAEFWENLRNGVESVSWFSDEELLAAGIPESVFTDPAYVRARPVIDGVDEFDGSFFGYSPREAELMDPQHRLFLETSWTALEHAGYDPWRFPGSIGLFAGSNISTYLLGMLAGATALDDVPDLEVAITNDRDSLTTRVSYKLNLKGPSVVVQTFCSTSLVATHLACRSLVDRECDMALAGGVSLRIPQKVGYRFDPGGQDSPDGHTRSFDAQARGTVFGDGVGIVVLKRLQDARRDGDTIHAVLLGSAINNDGSLKIGYTAPSVEGQAEAVAAALAQADVSSETIDFVEAHGSATELGDPVEVSALTKAFRLSTARQGFCALGSVKSNTGHLDRAAGVTGLIKTVLALQHGELPPSLHFEEPNPKIDFAASPFFVNAELQEWRRNGRPRRAGVNSLGVGGTNVHVVLEEAPPAQPGTASRPWQVLLLSARTETALDRAGESLQQLLARQSTGLGAELLLPDVAYTLAVGRRQMDHRRFVVCRDGGEAADRLAGEDGTWRRSGAAPAIAPDVAFLFPSAEQHLDMAAALYRDEPLFREEIDRCAAVLADEIEVDLRDLVYTGSPERRAPGGGARRLFVGRSETSEAAVRLDRIHHAHPALFAVEYALARLLKSWGVRPAAMLGHSLGEYVAACLAGVFSLEDALRVVARRARLIHERLPDGAMVAVPLGEEEVRRKIGDELSVAAVNAPAVTLVSGSAAAIEGFETRLGDEGVVFQRVKTDFAAHSGLMEEIADEMRELVEAVSLSAPRIPFISDVSGTWIEAEEATDPEYWVKHLCGTVQFADGVGVLLGENYILLEVGPGQSLTSFVKLHPAYEEESEVKALPCLPGGADSRPDHAVLFSSLGRLWLSGVAIDWPEFYAREQRRRIPLPTYPFERQRYWIEGRPWRLGGGTAPSQDGAESLIDLARNPDPGDWFYLPSWRQMPPLTPRLGNGQDGAARHSGGNGNPGESGVCLVLGGLAGGFAEKLVERLAATGRKVVCVGAGEEFNAEDSAQYRLDPDHRGHFQRLLELLTADGVVPDEVLHLWCFEDEADDLDRSLRLGFRALLHLAQAHADVARERPLRISVITTGLQPVTGDESLRPTVSPIIGPCLVLPQELPHVGCRCIDVDRPEGGSQEDVLIEQLVLELGLHEGEAMVAYRSARRWAQAFEPLRLERDEGLEERLPWRRRGVYLVTGGLGGIGSAVAEHLHRRLDARLVLVGRTGLPPREEWAERRRDGGAIGERIGRVEKLEEAGAEVLVAAADVADRDAMTRVVTEAVERFGALHGIFHCAGLPASGLMTLKTREMTERVLAPKVQGTLVIEEATRDLPLDFMVLFSSMTSATGGGPGQIDYSAANAFLDAFAQSRAYAGRRVLAIDWGEWQWDAWQEGLTGFDPQLQSFFKKNRQRVGITFEEGMEAIERLLAAPVVQAVVSTQDFAKMVELSQELDVGSLLAMVRKDQGERPLHPRPPLGSSYVEPRGEMEETIAAIWRDMLRLEEIGAEDNFFDLGGNSLLGVDLVRVINRELNAEIPTYALYEAPSVAAMARFIEPSAEDERVLDERRERGAARRERQRRIRERAREGRP